MDTLDLTTWQPQLGDALLIVDVQNDFLPGGKLGVPHGDEIISRLNDYLRIFIMRHLPIYATRDWHPSQHCSFHSQGGNWPTHCVAGTFGAEFASTLQLPDSTIVISKATIPEEDAYSGFQHTNLDADLHSAGIQRLLIGGLATDYCVLNTVRDALNRGYHVYLLIDAIRAIDAQPNDGIRALDEMKKLGAQFITLQKVSSAS